MGLLDRLWRVIRANITSLVSQAEDPEKILDQAVDDMQADLIQLRQSAAQAIAIQKRTERQYAQAKSTAAEWYNRAQLALQKGEDDLARQALMKRQTYLETTNAMEGQLQQQRQVVAKLKDNMRVLESKIAEAKTKRDMYIARARSAQASQRINEMIGRVGTNDAIAAFDRMEEKVLNLEAQSDALAELNTAGSLEARFAELEGNPNSVEAELAAMKTRLRGSTDPGSGSLPPGESGNG